ncbi:hypothetical protein BC941DRAFT_467075 [Chlamydoabsidia padenii]|nr:hypothetical protein BC941DRAFT_467075 [Chlamydoabsidia padenii]
MSTDLDLVLQDLEKQVNDFSLDITGTTNDSIQSNMAHLQSRQLDTNDDGGNLGTPLTTSKNQASPKSIGLARTLSATGTRKFPKKLIPDEPIPCLPPQASISSPTSVNTSLPSSLASNCVTKDVTTASLQQGVPLTMHSVLTHHNETRRGTTRQHGDSPQYHHQSTTPTSPEKSIIAPTKTMATRIFIENATTFKIVQMTNVLTTAMVIQYLKRKGLLDNSEDWTLFEIANSHGVERPLRLWEIVMDITCCWEQNVNNALLVKKYNYYGSLTMNAINHRPSPIHGWLNIEYKKGKWQKRYCFIKDNTIHYAKDSKCANSAIFCPLAGFDVYTLLQPLSTCPTPFAFALRAQNRAAIFEKEYDYIRLLAAENQENMETWVLGIRQAKSIIHYQEYPERVQNPLAPLTTTSLNSGGESNLRRHKSTRREQGTQDTSCNDDRLKGISHGEPTTTRRTTDEAIKRKASTRGLSRNPTTSRHREHPSPHQHDPIVSPITADEGISSNMNGSHTLVHIEDKVQFSKGSLLAHGISTSTNPHSPPQQNSSRIMMSRSKSTRETSASHQQPKSQVEGTILSHHTSIRRKDRNQHRYQHDVPLPNTSAIMTLSTGNPLSTTTSPTHSTNPTLLQLNNTPERFHTQTLLNRQMKPLLNFDQEVSLDQRRS